jgi:hypothetical protein
LEFFLNKQSPITREIVPHTLSNMKTLFLTPMRTLATLAGASALALPAFGASLRYTIAAGPDNGRLGASLAALDDLDADGVADFALGDPGYTASGAANSGQVLILSGADGSTLHSLLGTPAAGQAFGTALAALDADGDGVSDLAVGAPGGNGAVWIFSGADGSVLQAITAASPGTGSRFGQALANAGDQNADAKDDLFAGAPGAGTLTGAVQVLSGSDGALLGSITPELAGIEFGAALATVGDLSGDGLPDLAVGAPSFSSNFGRVQLLAGNDGAELFVLPGAVAGARLGSTLGKVDDRNADSVADLIVGSGSGGGAFLVSGSDLSVITDLSLAGAAAGLPVGGGGFLDIDLNGTTEMLVGYPGASPLAQVKVIPDPVAPEPNVYDAAAAGSGLGSAITVIPGFGFALGEPLAAGGAVHVYSVLADSDGDGVPDIDDRCPDSILTPTVVFGDLDTGVENRVNEDGCSLADLFAALEPASGWKNHGQVVSSSVKLVNRLLRSGDIDAAEAQALRTGAAQSNLGMPSKPGKPEKPTKPEKPGKPEKPEKPAKPEKPNKPNKPNRP